MKIEYMVTTFFIAQKRLFSPINLKYQETYIHAYIKSQLPTSNPFPICGVAFETFIIEVWDSNCTATWFAGSVSKLITS